MRRRCTISLDATRVPSISIALDRYTHTIRYILPNWDAPGAARLAQAWDGTGLGFPPTGD
jgi:hypothetical protein